MSEGTTKYRMKKRYNNPTIVNAKYNNLSNH